MVQRTHHMTMTEFEAFIERPENADRLLELINGEIVEKLPTEEHGMIVGNVYAPLRAFVKPRKLGRVTIEGLHRLPDDDLNAVLPDVSFRSNLDSPVVRRGAVSVMPDLAVEVQSPSQSEDFLVEKAAYYLANGCRMVWLVFPTRRVVEVHRPGGQVEIFTEADTLNGGDVLPGFELPVSDIFDLD
jgi:Uma2 family endonuclease